MNATNDNAQPLSKARRLERRHGTMSRSNVTDFQPASQRGRFSLRPEDGVDDEDDVAQTELPALLKDPRLLDRIKEIIRARGYAGDVRPSLLVYFALTSRLLPRPLNVNLVAQSASGKNRAVNGARELVPEAAVYFLSAGSQRALIYVTESLEHRVVVLAEADSIPDDGPAASAMRALAEDNELVYAVAEQGERGSKTETRMIHKKGPTGLITTSTKRLPKQMNTRVLEVSINDGPTQTRAVLRATARAVMPEASTIKPDVEPFVAIQTWLQTKGERRVVVPFAEALAELVPIREVRMRRDFPQLLTVIQTSALLHQAQRNRTPAGEIIATLDDYKIARGLVSAIFDAISDDGLTPAIRETVEAIEPKETISQADLVERLSLSKATVSDRVRVAIEKGWLVSERTDRGKTRLLRHGEPLPEAGTALPTVESVRQRLSEHASNS